ncbi:BMP family ABC transporter substrate-binding protein [Promicromonospora citrea]|uniref:ABC transporter substrate-binding protein PnrA-like domain-containing protein n=1 Tax=Promicromonospora citrea TaxID=43677 RepID=A0A8H9GQD4_9MICO|nr:BMP family ABC transporter substrate-binding protein [Promicromonospora citrea]NNH53787.1 BMP family ABC transporter substrate-binding protein [Promicromonospora citrea]GGM37590.1 hypothetical protein GCM10010102_36480 [Promicromonospora citrea]
MRRPLRPATGSAGRRLAGTAAGAALVVLLAACGSVPGGAPAAPGADPASSAAPLTPAAARFAGSAERPAPEATVRPVPGTWADAGLPAGSTVVLVTRGDDAATATLTDAVRQHADAHGADLTVLRARDDDEVERRIDEAVASSADLVVGAGDGVVDVFSLVTAQYLGTQFLVVGAQLPEPTHNVTAVVWPGAEFRGTGLGNEAADPASVTPERARDAVGAGVASVRHGLTGIVVELPAR